jgi:hypothetical protein
MLDTVTLIICYIGAAVIGLLWIAYFFGKAMLPLDDWPYNDEEYPPDPSLRIQERGSAKQRVPRPSDYRGRTKTNVWNCWLRHL